MNKFAIISAVLVFSVVTVMGDFVIRDYVGRQAETSVITADNGQQTGQNQQIPDNITNVPAPTPQTPQAFPVDSTDTQVAATPAGKITEALISQAGFTGVLTEKHFDGKVFQLLDITKTPVSSIGYFEETVNGAPVTSVTEIILPDEIRALQMYVLLQNKTKTYIDLSLNETNAYGDRSFYINHAKKPDEAFLTVKIGKTIYCFAYVKSYHPQIKQLISLLTQ